MLSFCASLFAFMLVSGNAVSQVTACSAASSAVETYKGADGRTYERLGPCSSREIPPAPPPTLSLGSQGSVAYSNQIRVIPSQVPTSNGGSSAARAAPQTASAQRVAAPTMPVMPPSVDMTPMFVSAMTASAKASAEALATGGYDSDVEAKGRRATMVDGAILSDMEEGLLDSSPVRVASNDGQRGDGRNPSTILGRPLGLDEVIPAEWMDGTANKARSGAYRDGTTWDLPAGRFFCRHGDLSVTIEQDNDACPAPPITQPGINPNPFDKRQCHAMGAGPFSPGCEQMRMDVRAAAEEKARYAALPPPPLPDRIGPEREKFEMPHKDGPFECPVWAPDGVAPCAPKSIPVPALP